MLSDNFLVGKITFLIIAIGIFFWQYARKKRVMNPIHTDFDKPKFHLSTLGLILGFCILIASSVRDGLFIILGIWAYRSIKKRKYLEASHSLLRLAFEGIVLVLIAMKIISTPNNLFVYDGLVHGFIPLWTFIAYFYWYNRTPPPRTKA
jgi:hypothetical protein